MSLGELAGVLGRIADREEGRVGVEVDRRGIQGELRLAALKIKPHHPADRLEQPDLELDPQPVAPFALADCQLPGRSFGLERDAPAFGDRP